MHPRRHDSRRPRRRDSNEGPRGRLPRGDSGLDRDRSEREFTEEMHGRFQQFLASDEQAMALEPMNSFKRRVVHNLAKDYGIETESRGEERERHVYLTRTAASATPRAAPHREPEKPAGRVDDEGAEEYQAEADGPYPAQGEQEADGRSSPQRHAPRRGRRSDERPERGFGREWDFGSQTFPCNPGEHGVHIAVKRDGSIELFQERDRGHVVAERLVTSKHFRVRKGRIIQPGEPGW